METFAEKLEMIASLFKDPVVEQVGDNLPLQDGTYHGGIYNGRKFMYSDYMINNLPLKELERIIRKQTNL